MTYLIKNTEAAKHWDSGKTGVRGKENPYDKI